MSASDQKLTCAGYTLGNARPASRRVDYPPVSFPRKFQAPYVRSGSGADIGHRLAITENTQGFALCTASDRWEAPAYIDMLNPSRWEA